MYEFEILLEYHKGGQDATETSEGGNLKKKRVLIQNTKRTSTKEQEANIPTEKW